MATGYLVAAIECNTFTFHNKVWVLDSISLYDAETDLYYKTGDTCYLLSGTNYERLA